MAETSRGSVLAHKLAWRQGPARMELLCPGDVPCFPRGAVGISWETLCPSWDGFCRDGGGKSPVCVVYVVLDPRSSLFTLRYLLCKRNSPCNGYLDHLLLSPKIKRNFVGGIRLWAIQACKPRQSKRWGEKVNHRSLGSVSVRQKSIVSFQFAALPHPEWNYFSYFYMGKL